MAFYPNRSLRNFTFDWIETSIASREITEWNENPFVRRHCAVVNRLIAFERRSVELDGYAGP
jgi:hypothetical protein